jgi:hypothetical protein
MKFMAARRKRELAELIVAHRVAAHAKDKDVKDQLAKLNDG